MTEIDEYTLELTDNHVCEECLKKTKIGYDDKGGFFTPHFRSINHVEVGYSKIISNPLTILIERLYVMYDKFKDWLAGLGPWLFPRREKIYGKCMDSSLVGKIIFANKGDIKIPIHHLNVEFWSRGRLGRWYKLSGGVTAMDGTFNLPFDLSYARRFRVRTLRFEIYQLSHFFYSDQESKKVHQLFKYIKIPKGDMIGMAYNLRTIPLFLWEYRDDTNLPRAVIKNHDKDAPQYYSEGRTEAFNAQVIPVELTKLKHLEQIRIAPETISLAQIQSDYPENLTVCIEKKLPGYTRSDHWFGKRMMNGMNRGYFMPEAVEEGTYWMKYFGKLGYSSNDEYAFPDSYIKYKLKPNGLPEPVAIYLRGALNAFDRNPWQERTFTPADGAYWEYAKRIARVNGGLCTEVDEHFASTHVNTEQYAIAAYRNLRLSPVATLLFPHLKSVVLINHAADKILLKEYIPSASAFTYEGLLARCEDIMGVLDWKSWKPMKVLSDAHTYAKAEHLFYELTAQFVDYFIDTNLEAIKKYWVEIYLFSEDLVNHSVPVFLSGKDESSLSEKEKQRNAEMKEYLGGQFVFDFNLPRQTRNGQLKTVSPITLSPSLSPETEHEEITQLKKACTYMIFVATYLHTWANEHQYEDIGEVLYNSLGLRFGDKESGVLAPESDLAIAPDLTRSTQMMWFSNLLSRTEYGFITRNEEKDVNPYFSALLESKRKEFADLGVIIDNIESRTNI